MCIWVNSTTRFDQGEVIFTTHLFKDVNLYVRHISNLYQDVLFILDVSVLYMIEFINTREHTTNHPHYCLVKEYW